MGAGGIPKHDHAGVIPPFLGEPTSANCSPYRATIADVVARFGTSKKRRDILRGLLRYRAELRAEGFDGFQWLDGGFLDQKAQEPNDVDVITFYRRKDGWDVAFLQALAERRGDLFSETFSTFACDAYFVDLDDDNRDLLVRQIAYWVGLFSHQRITAVRRGLVQVVLGPADEDEAACAMLQTLDDLDESAVGEEPKP